MHCSEIQELFGEIEKMSRAERREYMREMNRDLKRMKRPYDTKGFHEIMDAMIDECGCLMNGLECMYEWE